MWMKQICLECWWWIVLFSFQGQSWYDFDLGDQPLNVDNVVIEPNSSSVEFLLYGSREGAGVLYHLDFATLGQLPCKGVWAADSVSSDYETWTPTGKRSYNRYVDGVHGLTKMCCYCCSCVV